MTGEILPEVETSGSSENGENEIEIASDVVHVSNSNVKSIQADTVKIENGGVGALNADDVDIQNIAGDADDE